MKDFSSLIAQVNDLKAKVEECSITPVYLGGILEDFIGQMKGLDLSDKCKEFSDFLGTYPKTDTLADLLKKKADKTITINAGTGLSGGGDLSSDRSLSLAKSGVAAGTYPKVTVDVYGRVTSGSPLDESDIPSLAISKISGLTDALDAKAAKSDLNNLRTLFCGLFVPYMGDTALTWAQVLAGSAYDSVKLNAGLWTESFLTAKGRGSGIAGGGSFDASILDDYAKKQWVQSQGYVTAPTLAAYLTKAKADTLYQPLGDYAAANHSHSQYALASALSDYALASSLTAHTADTTAHISATERTKWNKTATDLAAILGTDSDTIINKWEEVVAFLDTYTEADTLAGLLGNKVDKVAGYGLSKNDFNDALLAKLNGIEAGANKYVHPAHTAYTVAAATGRVLSAISVDALGHVTSVGSKALTAADIPDLSISKITGLQDALDSKAKKQDFEDFVAKFDSMFVKETDASAPEGFVIRAKAGLYTYGFLTAKGRGGTPSQGGTFDPSVLDGYAEKTWVQQQGYVTSATLSAYLTKTKADTLYQPVGNYALASHTHSEYAAASHSHSQYALASSLNDHIADTVKHITATERAAWNNKVDKVAGKGLSENDFTDALLSKLNGIAAGANNYVLPKATADVLGGVRIGANISLDAATGKISTHAPYVHPSHTIRNIAAAAGLVLASVSVNALGHVTNITSKQLAAADIPALAISKITGLQGVLDAKAAKADLEVLRSLLYGMFTPYDGTTPLTWAQVIAGSSYDSLKASGGLWTESFMSAKGKGTLSGGSGSGSFDPSVLDGYAQKTWVQGQGYVTSATLAGYLAGYLPYKALNGGLSAVSSVTTWGVGTGTTVAEWDAGGSAIKLKKDCPAESKLSLLIDGTVYVNEGQDAVATQAWASANFNKYTLTKAAVEAVLTGNITSHTHSQYLTSHQSLSNYVTLNTTQTISGAKTFGSSIKTNGPHGAWLSGKTTAAIMFNGLAAIDSTSAWYFYNMKSASGHTIAFGGLGDRIGFYTFLADRTVNDTDSSLECNTANGQWSTNKNFTAAAFIKRNGTASQFLMADGSVKALTDITSAYVTALGTSGNYLTWTKNGAVSNITVPYATEALRFKSAILNNGDDLNSFVTSGLYHTTQTSVCMSLLNGPTGRTNGELWFDVRNVGASGYGSQFLFTRASTNFEYWARTFDASGTFSAWQKFLTDTNYASILDSRYALSSSLANYYTKTEADGRYMRHFWTSNPGYDCSTHNTKSLVSFTYGNNAPFIGAFIDVNTTGYGFYLGTTSFSDGSLYYRRHGQAGDGGMGAWQQLARVTDTVANANALGGVALERFVYGDNATGTHDLGTALSDTARKSGFYRANSDDNASLFIHCSHSTNTYAFQIGTLFADSRLKFRHLINNTWSSWCTLLDTMNYASTLDSRYYTETEINTQLTAYVKKSGDTMTGALSLPRLNIVGTAASSAFLTAGTPTNAFVDVGGKTLMVWDADSTSVRPGLSMAGQIALGTSAVRWSNVYATTINVTSTTLVSNLNADMLDGHHKDDFNAVARFGTTTQYSSGYYKIKIKSIAAWMLGFKILAYQNYCFDEIDVSGYNYGADHWHQPSASLVNSQGLNPKSSIAVTFGYDSEWNLWVAIPATYYAGITVTDVTNGYSQVADYHSLFEIVYESSLTGTVQTTVTASRHAMLTDNVASATKLQTARSIWGQSFDGSGNVSGNITGVGSINTYLSAIGGSGLARLNIAGIATDTDYIHLYVDGNGNNKRPLVLQNGYGNVGIGTSTPSYKLHVMGDIYANDGWLRTSGACGWCSQTYGGGWYMTDGTYIRNHNYKSLYLNGTGTNDLLHIKNGGITIDAYGGGAWNSGSGRINLPIVNDSNQSSLIVAYRSGTTDWIGDTLNRLFAMELLNSGAQMGFCFEGETKFRMYRNGELYATAGMYTPGFMTAKKTGGSSDERLKKNIRERRLSIETILNAPCVGFDWRDGSGRGVGTLAQYWLRRLPEVVLTDPDGYYAVDYGALAHIEVSSLAKYLAPKIEDNEAKIKRLEMRVAALEKENMRLKARAGGKKNKESSTL